MPLDPAAVEQDILEFLRHRYGQENRPALAGFVAARLAGDNNPFSDWLRQLDTAPLGAADLERLAADSARPKPGERASDKPATTAVKKRKFSFVAQFLWQVTPLSKRVEKASGKPATADGADAVVRN